MASQLIAHVAAWYIPTGQPLVNDMDGLTIDGAYRLEAQRMRGGSPYAWRSTSAR